MEERMGNLTDPFYFPLEATRWWGESALTIELKFSLLPRRCYLSGKWIWLQYAYKLTRIWTGPGEPIVEHRWHDKLEHIIWQLKK